MGGCKMFMMTPFLHECFFYITFCIVFRIYILYFASDIGNVYSVSEF